MPSRIPTEDERTAQHDRLVARAGVHAALGEPVRLAIVERLAMSDMAPVEIGAALGVSSNLLAHHLDVLESARLITRHPSEGDARRRYISLHHGALEELVAPLIIAADRVLFVCQHNSARSQIAAAFWRSQCDVPAESAGTEPADHVHPQMVRVARERGLVLSDPPRPLDAVTQPPDLVVSVCDISRESLAAFSEVPRLHWSIPDPVPTNDPRAFNAAAEAILERVERLAPRVVSRGDEAHERYP